MSSPKIEYMIPIIAASYGAGFKDLWGQELAAYTGRTTLYGYAAVMAFLALTSIAWAVARYHENKETAFRIWKIRRAIQRDDFDIDDL